MKLSNRKTLMKHLGSFSLRDSKSNGELEKARDLYDLMCTSDQEETVKRPYRKKVKKKEFTGSNEEFADLIGLEEDKPLSGTTKEGAVTTTIAEPVTSFRYKSKSETKTKDLIDERI